MGVNNAEARVHRLQSFMLTQRAVYEQGFEISSSKDCEMQRVPLNRMAEMVSCTVLCTSNVSSYPEAPQSLLRPPSEVGWDRNPTVIELAQSLSAKGKKVAAVNAASAFHV